MLLTTPSLLLSVHTGNDVHSAAAGVSLTWSNAARAWTWPLVLRPSTAEIKTSEATHPFIHIFQNNFKFTFQKKKKINSLAIGRSGFQVFASKTAILTDSILIFFRSFRQMLWKLIVCHGWFLPISFHLIISFHLVFGNCIVFDTDSIVKRK